jgi:RND family efflux transporter MFP subunit
MSFRSRLTKPFSLIAGLFACTLLLPLGVQGNELDCLIEPYVTVKVSSAVNGLLETVLVDRGDLVKKGQVLATLESGAEKAAIDALRARATMEAAIKANQARLDLSVRSHERADGMFQKALLPADKLDEAQTTKRLAEMAVLEAADNRRLAALELQRATVELERRTVRSPVTGVVMERLQTAGEFATVGNSPAEPIMRIAQLDPLRVEVFVPVAMLKEVAIGKKAEVVPQAPVGGTYTAKVTIVDHVIDAASGTFGVRLELPNRDYRLRAGLKCRIHFLQD